MERSAPKMPIQSYFLLHLFRNFNVALTECDYTLCPDNVPSHYSKYAFSSSLEGDILTATYEVNEQNFPIKGTFKTSYDNSNEYWYYECDTVFYWCAI